MVRALFTHLLVGLLLACPHLCRATDDACCADHELTSRTPDEHHAPAPAGDAASCICGGAIKAAENRIHGPGPEGRWPSPGPFLFDCIPSRHFSLNARLAWSGSPPEEDAWQGSRLIHVLFQHFRC
jgi:hypothetical protein